LQRWKISILETEYRQDMVIAGLGKIDGNRYLYSLRFCHRKYQRLYFFGW